jgi:hypothetical protein
MIKWWIRNVYRVMFRSKRCLCGRYVDVDRPICTNFPAQCVDRDQVYTTVRLGLFKRAYHWDDINHDPARYH